MKRLLLCVLFSSSLWGGTTSFTTIFPDAVRGLGAMEFACAGVEGELARRYGLPSAPRDVGTSKCTETSTGLSSTFVSWESATFNEDSYSLTSCTEGQHPNFDKVVAFSFSTDLVYKYTCNYTCKNDNSTCLAGQTINPNTCQCETTCPVGQVPDTNGNCVPNPSSCTDPDTNFPAIANNEKVIATWGEDDPDLSLTCTNANGQVQTQTQNCVNTYQCVYVTDECNPIAPVITGSYVEPRSGVFHEDIAIDGTNLYLHYQSNSDIDTIATAWGISTHAVLKEERLILGNERVYNVEGKLTYGINETRVSINGLKYVFDTNNLHTQTRSAYTNTVLYSFAYDDNQRLISISDSYNQTSQIIRNTEGVVLSIVSPYSNQTMLTVNGNLQEVRYEDSNSYVFEYENNLLTKKTNPNQYVYTYVYNEQGHLISSINPTGVSIDFSQDKVQDGITDNISFAENESTQYKRYNLDNNTIRIEKRLANGELIVYESLIDDSQSTRSACGTITTSNYAGTNPITNRRELVSQTTNLASGLSKTTQYDTSYVFDNETLISKTSVQTSNQKTLSTTTDYLNYTQTSTSPEGRVLTQTYDATMQNITQTSVNGIDPTHYTYDTQGRLIQVQQGTRITQYTYDDKGNLASFTNAKGETTRYEYDLRNRKMKEIYADSNEVNFSYDANSNQTELVTPTPASFNFQYNSIDAPSVKTSPLGLQTSYLYNEQKRFINITRPSGKTIAYNYFKGELISTTTPEHNYAYKYSCGGKLSQVVKDDLEEVNYNYDGDLMTSMEYKGELNQILNYTYNNDFLIDSITYADQIQNLTYDKDGLLIQSNDYIIKRKLKNGLVAKVENSTYLKKYKYNTFAEINKEVYKIDGNLIYKNRVAARNKNGQIKKRVERLEGKKRVYFYTYDERNRLIKTKTVDKEQQADGSFFKVAKSIEEYSYDNNGNRLKATLTTNDTSKSITTSYTIEDQIDRVGAFTYTYDEDGYLQSKTDGNNTTVYQYGTFGELKKVSLANGDIIDYRHNASNQRVAKLKNGVLVEKYLWKDLTTLLAVYDKDNTLKQRFTYTDRRTPTSFTDINNTTYYIAYDQVGSPRVVYTENGQVIKEMIYDSFGTKLHDTNEIVKIPFGFAGGLYDDDTGLVRFGYRDYNSVTGRWTAKDPIGFDGGDTSLYGYVLGDPVNFVDPTGLRNFREDWCSIFGCPDEKEIFKEAYKTARQRSLKDPCGLAYTAAIEYCSNQLGNEGVRCRSEVNELMKNCSDSGQGICE